METIYKTEVVFKAIIATGGNPRFRRPGTTDHADHLDKAIETALRLTFEDDFLMACRVTTITKTIPLTEAT